MKEKHGHWHGKFNINEKTGKQGFIARVTIEEQHLWDSHGLLSSRQNFKRYFIAKIVFSILSFRT